MSKKTVILEVGESHKILKLGFNGLIELEELLGKPVTEIADGEIQFSDLRSMFFVALRRGGSSVSLDETGDILDDVIEEKGMDYLTGKLTDLFNSAMGQKQTESFLATTSK